jgi:3-dehydroquinate synthase class II
MLPGESSIYASFLSKVAFSGAAWRIVPLAPLFANFIKKQQGMVIAVGKFRERF